MKVSVILTSYNHEKYICKSVDSILNQTFQDFELVIYDDASRDHSPELLAAYQDVRIRLIVSGFHRGTGLVEYILSNFVHGEYVAIAHSDDYWEADKLEKQVAYLDAHRHVAAVFTGVNVVNEKGKPYEDRNGFYYHAFHVKNRERHQWLRYFFYYGNCLCHPSVMIRRCVYEKYQLFPKALRQTPDFYMWIRLCLYADIFILQEKLTNFRVREMENNVSGYRKETSIRSATEIKLLLRQFLGLTEYDEFLKTFPEAAPYAKKDYFLPAYAFARICTQEERPNYVKAYGLELLYDLLHTETTARQLKKNYGFEMKDFYCLTGKWDIYGLYPNCSIETVTFYLDCGEGYLEMCALRYDYEFWQKRQMVKAEFTEAELCAVSKNRIQKIRFDPIENAFVKCRILGFQINRKERQICAKSSFCLDGDDVFITSDPGYEYENSMAEDVRQLQVVFEIERLSADELDQRFVQAKAEAAASYGIQIDKTNHDIEALQEAMAQKEQDIRELKEVLGLRDRDIEELKGALMHRDKDIGELKEVLAHRDRDIMEMKNAVEARNAQIVNLQKNVDSRKRNRLDMIINRKKRKPDRKKQEEKRGSN